ncbi:5-methylthioadenosine/S-adenosylhomocysteine deaminase [bacterium BMS3Bbin09]|nr:5-methylthioadenosine/S-adenosylhomocysteine deaminase [bacterium BMS3Bbin09]
METVDCIIRAEYLLTMEGDLSVINDGAIAISSDTIQDVGTFAEITKKYSSEKVLCGKNKVVFPGLINTHSHAAMVYFRGLADDIPLQEWLEKHIWPAEGKWMSAEFVDDAVGLACLEMLKSGVTTYTDQYFFQSIAAKKVTKIGMRGVLGAGVIDFPFTGYASSVEDYFTNAENLINEYKDDELITPCIAPHATYTCSPENYRRANEISAKYNVPIHTHVAETQFEISQIKDRYGKTPVEHLDAIGLLTERFIAVHCVWLTDKDIEILAERKVGVSHCIESNLKLASGIAPVPKLLNAGVKVAFGTDGAASNNDLSILGEMSTAAKVHKAISGDPTVLDSKTALLMATKNGADIIGLGDKVGSIKAGKKADIVIANLNKPHLSPIYDIYSHITYSMRPSDIETVLVNGKVVVDNRTLTTMDEAEILGKAREWQAKIKE